MKNSKVEKFFLKLVENLLHLLTIKFEKLTLWGIVLVGWSILFFWGGSGAGWEKSLDRCGWVRVSGVGALFGNAH